MSMETTANPSDDDRSDQRSGRCEVPKHLGQIAKGTRFREDVYGAQLARPVRCFGLGMSREDDHRQIGKSASNARENRKAIKSGHDEIEENAIDRRGFHDIEGFDPVEGYQYVVSFDTQHFREHL